MEPDEYHGVSQYDVTTGAPIKPAKINFSSCFGQALCHLAEEDPRVCGITAAMQPGTGLDGFALRFPNRFFDVGIAEGHAVAMAAGMAKQGAIPVFAVYSSFLQRGFDMLIHDVAIQHLHVVFAVDRAGLVGEDGETHHGIFDIAYLSLIPGMTVLAPSNFAELESMLRRAVFELDGPVAIRYPRGGEGTYREDFGQSRAVCLASGQNITLVGYGMMINQLLQVKDRLYLEGYRAEVIKLNDVSHLDEKLLCDSVRRTGALLVAEDCIARDCVGQRISAMLEEKAIPAKVTLCNLGMRFIPQGTVAQLQQYTGLDSEGLYVKAKEICFHGEKTTGCIAD